MHSDNNRATRYFPKAVRTKLRTPVVNGFLFAPTVTQYFSPRKSISFTMTKATVCTHKNVTE